MPSSVGTTESTIHGVKTLLRHIERCLALSYDSLGRMDAKLVPSLEIDVPDVPIGGSSGADLVPCPRQVGDEEYGNRAAFEQPPLPLNSFIEGADQRLEYEPGSSVPEHVEHRTTNDFHGVSTNLEDAEQLNEQAANTEVVGALDEQVDQELVSDSAKHLEHSATNNHHGVGTNVEDVEELHEQAANTELLGSPYEQEVGQKLVSDSAKHLEHRVTNDLHDVGTIMEDVEELHEEAANTNEQEVAQELVSVSDRHLEHRATDDLHDAGTNMEDVEEVHEQTANTEEVGLPDTREVDQELISVSERHLEHDLHDVGTNMVNIEEVHEQPANTEVVGSLDEHEHEKGQEFVSDPEKHLAHRASNDLHDVGKNLDNVQEVHEQVANTEEVGSPVEQEVDQELGSLSAKPQSKEEKNVKHSSSKPGSLIKDCRVRYQLPPENEGELAVFDLVWGKVKSHPWWPGQIFHPSDSSEKAMKYYKKDCYLVAYFGDRTFAWNDASVLKPFRNHFSQAERQNKTEAFQNAVSCALEEVTRRVELGLACSCVSKVAYDKIKYQIVENSGIREESSKREGVDRSTGGDSFQPDKLTDYVKALAVFPTSGFDRLELVIAKAQLLAFNQLRGCEALPEFQYYDGLAEYNADILPGNQRSSDDNEPVTRVDGNKGPRKRKHNLKDIVYQRRKEKSVTDLMGESMYYLDGEFDSHEEDDIYLASPAAGSARKAGEFVKDDFTAPQSTKTISVAKVSHKASPNPQQSFKVGECIRRVANQMTGSSIIVKDCSEESNKHLGDDVDEVLEPQNDSLTENTPIPANESSLEGMLSQLHLSAINPMKRYSFFGEIISFFTEFRNVAVVTQRQRMRKGSCRKKKSSVPAVGSSQNFEFDDRNDSYWRDMVVQDTAEPKPARRGRKRKDEQGISGDHQKPVERKPRKYSRKQYHNGNHESVPVPVMPTGNEKHLNLPTELMLNFGEMGSVPSEVSLNKMFKRFGPLKESETEVDMQSSRARVVFKKRSDAEVAYSSAAMFNIFGSTLVNYQLNYTPIGSFKNPSPPPALTNGKEDAS
ncbi:putative oxidoreductase GLYR1 [Bienertia sinuspersici]